MSHPTTTPSIVSQSPQNGLQVVAISNICKRNENQDTMAYAWGDAGNLLVVADGMGGHSGGYEASRIAAATITECFDQYSRGMDPTEFLTYAISEANRHVFMASQADPSKEGMGTTVVVAFVRNNKMWLGHVGDSRAYLKRDQNLFLLTMDHSRVNRMVMSNLISIHEAENHPMGHILERCIGVEPQVEVEVTQTPFPLVAGDRIILCSDGFSGEMTDENIISLFNADNLQNAVQAAIDAVIYIGEIDDERASDNTTIGAFEVISGPPVGPTPRDVRRELQQIALKNSIVTEKPKPLPTPTRRINKPPSPSPTNKSIVVFGVALVLLILGVIYVMKKPPPDDEPAEESREQTKKTRAPKSPKPEKREKQKSPTNKPVDVYTQTMCDMNDGLTCHVGGGLGVCEDRKCTDQPHWLPSEEPISKKTFIRLATKKWKTENGSDLPKPRSADIFEWGDVDNDGSLSQEEAKYVLSPLQWRKSRIEWEWSDNAGPPSYKPEPLDKQKPMSFEVFTRLTAVYLRSFGVQPRKDVLQRVFEEHKLKANAKGLTFQQFKQLLAPRYWSFMIDPPALSEDEISRLSDFKLWSQDRSAYYGRAEPEKDIIKRVLQCAKHNRNNFEEKALHPFKWRPAEEDWGKPESVEDFWQSRFEDDTAKYEYADFRQKVDATLAYCGWGPESISPNESKQKFSSTGLKNNLSTGKKLKKLPIPIDW